MRLCSWMLAVLLLAVAVVSLPAGADDKAPEVAWKKTIVDKAFRSEGVAVADVNKDGKLDILVGDFWYEAPDWKKHEIRKSEKPMGFDPQGYSKCFACWADDINGDGWADLVVVGYPGQAALWYENPQGKEGHWKEHVIWKSACNETPQYVDLFGTGKRVLLMAIQPEGQIAYFTPGKDPNAIWELHPISEKSTKDKKIPGTDMYSHGLGIGDVNGDGKMDVIVTGGWWEQPAKDDGMPWKFHPANFGGACADMFAFDIDGDGKPDVVSSSAHGFGIWAYLQKPGKDAPTFLKQDLFKDLVSQTHAMHLIDINGDGVKDLVTGKRWWAHAKGDPGGDQPAILYWFEAKKSKDGIISFTPHKIDDDSGVGTQFWVGDFNGDKLPDVVISNKKGVYVFEQVRK